VIDRQCVFRVPQSLHKSYTLFTLVPDVCGQPRSLALRLVRTADSFSHLCPLVSIRGPPAAGGHARFATHTSVHVACSETKGTQVNAVCPLAHQQVLPCSLLAPHCGRSTSRSPFASSCIRASFNCQCASLARVSSISHNHVCLCASVDAAPAVLCTLREAVQ
jgi:hypothetical protein